MTKQQVLLSVTGWAQDDNEKSEPIRLLTTGTLSGADDAWRIDYTETQPDDQAHQVVLTLDKGVVTMQRMGAFSTSMVFEKGHRFEGNYYTPYGALDMGVFATRVKYDVDRENGGEVDLQYQLDLQGQFASVQTLHIRFCPAKKA